MHWLSATTLHAVALAHIHQNALNIYSSKSPILSDWVFVAIGNFTENLSPSEKALFTVFVGTLETTNLLKVQVLHIFIVFYCCVFQSYLITMPDLLDAPS